MKERLAWRRTYTWQTIREGGSRGDEVDGFSEVMMDSAMAEGFRVSKGFWRVMK